MRQLSRCNSHGGYILLPVVLLLGLVALVAFLLGHEGSIGRYLTLQRAEPEKAYYVAEAGLQMAAWQVNQANCVNYSDIPATPLGDGSFTATISPHSGSPVDIIATGTLASGISRSLAKRVQAVETPVTLTLQPDSAAGKDAWAYKGYANNNYGTTREMIIDGGFWTSNFLLEFDLAAIPAGMTIISAQMDLYLQGVGSAHPAAAFTVYRMVEPWLEGTGDYFNSGDGATWNRSDGSSSWTWPATYDGTQPIATTVVNPSYNGHHSWDVTSLVQGWISGHYANNGLVVTGNAQTWGAWFKSSDANQDTQRPKLTITYSCVCGHDCSGGGPGPNLLFVTAGSTPNTQEQLRIDLINSWGYNVNTIEDNDSQANFDAAVAANDVAYVPETVSDTSLGTKLYAAPIGVVNEEQTPDFGLCSGFLTKNRDEIDIIDNTHYITSPYSTGLLTFLTGSDSATLMNSGLAPDLITLGEMLNVGSQWAAGLAVVDTGATLAGGGTAAGRRVQLPWGDGFDINLLNDAGKDIMKRSIEWAAYADIVSTAPIAHWKLDEGSGTLAADSVGGNDATFNGNPSWTTGSVDGALDFDGSDDTIVTDSNFTPPPVGTVVFWMQVSGSPTNRGRILGLADNWEIRHESTGSPDVIPYALAFDLGVGGSNQGFFTTTAIDTPGHWYHIAAAYDTNTDAYAVYIDGVLHNSGTYPTPMSVPAADLLTIGSRTGTSENFDGILDDVRIYDTMLSADEIADLYAEGDKTLLLLVVPDPSALSADDVARRTLIESWGYAVSLIDDSATQAQYDAAAAANDVVFVSSEVVAANLGTKLKAATIGVVNENRDLHNIFGFSTLRIQVVENPLMKTDLVHYITSPFSGGPITLFSSVQPIGAAVGTLPAGLEIIGSWFSGTLSSLGGLLTLETGGAIAGGGTAAGRRVQLPWSNADVGSLSTDGLTVFQRAIEWAAGAGGGSTPTGVVFAEYTDASLASNGTSLTITKPGGTGAGDLLIAAVVTDDKQQTGFNPPAGWNLVTQMVSNDGEAVSMGVWWKIAASSEPASYDFTWPADEQAYGWIMRFTGHDPANPINVAAQSNGFSESSSPPSPSVTTTVADTMILRIGGFDDDDITVGNPGLAGHTAITMDKSKVGNNNASGGAGYTMQSAAGASGTANFALTALEQWLTVTIAIAPAP